MKALKGNSRKVLKELAATTPKGATPNTNLEDIDMIALNGLHPKGLRNAYCWSRRELKDKLDGIIKPDTLEQYIAAETSTRYHEPPITVMITCYAVYQALVASGEVPVNEGAIAQYLVKPY